MPSSSTSSSLIPQTPRSLLHPSFLRPYHLLRLASRVAPRINLHLVPPPIYPAPVPIPIAFAPTTTTTTTFPALLPGGIATQRAIHQPGGASLPQLVDGANSINGRMQRPPRVEILLDRRQQVRVTADGFVGGGIGQGFDDERVGEGLVGGHADGGVDGQAFLDEVAGGEGDAAPVFERGEGEVGDEDGLHFFEVGVPVEGGVAAEEEVGYYAYGPDVAFNFDGECQVLLIVWHGMVGREGGNGGGLHWFTVAGLFEDFGSHVAWCAARCCEDVESFFVHDP